MSLEITVDFSEQIAEFQNKIEGLRNLIECINRQEKALSLLKKQPEDTKLVLGIPPFLQEYGSSFAESMFRSSITINAQTLMPILEQNIEDNTVLVHKLAKELGIEE
ncbi:DUF1359 domain-containing protein [Lactococcus lactis]|uniref:DUF1359 domain-containing protein n=1 Tax=Lactococcus lactis TaxID=1358 RepID=A0AAE4NTM3_9LACT|nr:DUF1359 domain-containing protein [Lactococcus lactis]MDV2633888.1 DUF1359 domain-containing protein [Lactococcus lactis]